MNVCMACMKENHPIDMPLSMLGVINASNCGNVAFDAVLLKACNYIDEGEYWLFDCISCLLFALTSTSIDHYININSAQQPTKSL